MKTRLTLLAEQKATKETERGRNLRSLRLLLWNSGSSQSPQLKWPRENARNAKKVILCGSVKYSRAACEAGKFVGDRSTHRWWCSASTASG